MMTSLSRLVRKLLGRNPSTRNQTGSSPERSARRSRRLEVERLEDRLTPASASGTITGVAFLDANQNNLRDAGDSALPGVTVKLSGMTTQGQAITIQTETNASGAYRFDNVLPGTYQFLSVNSLLIPNGSSAPTEGDRLIATTTISGGETVALDAAFRGLDARFVSLRSLLTSVTPEERPWGEAGEGLSEANYRSNDAPSLRAALDDLNRSINSSPTTIDLAGFFTDADFTNSLVRFDTSLGSLKVELFDEDTPRTVANFFNYVTSDRYDNTIFHRLISNFVLQGGGFKFPVGTSDTAVHLTTDAPVQNEFGVLNTTGTIAMAKTPNLPDSATSEFFFNLANNTNLNTQNSGFTVFGRLADGLDQLALNSLGTFPVQNRNAQADVEGLFGTLPLRNYTGTDFPTGTTEDNFLMLRDVAILRRDEFLTYSVVGNTDPGLVSTTIQDNRLTLTYAANQTGTATITVRAMDRYGASFDSSFNITVS